MIKEKTLDRVNAKFIPLKELIKIYPFFTIPALRGRVQRKQIPHYRFGSKIYVSLEEIEQLIESSRVDVEHK